LICNIINRFDRFDRFDRFAHENCLEKISGAGNFNMENLEKTMRNDKCLYDKLG
jgi:hypothetical protein